MSSLGPRLRGFLVPGCPTAQVRDAVHEERSSCVHPGSPGSMCYTCWGELRPSRTLGSKHLVGSGIYSKFLVLRCLKRKDSSV